MRWWSVFAVVGFGGCAPEPVCGLDEEDLEIPVCNVSAAGVQFEYCPGDHWAAEDGCNSCGCDPDGNVLCTQLTLEDCEAAGG